MLQSLCRHAGRIAVTVALGFATLPVAVSAQTDLPKPLPPGPARTALEAYLGAVAAGRYDVAFAHLTADERRYFETPANYASIFAADRLKLERFRIAGATSAAIGLVASVDETTQYLDDAQQSVDEAEGHVLYGLVREGDAYRIKDPYHPWRVVSPSGASTVDEALTVTIRKVSFFTGRVEIVVAFENRGDRAVTILPNRTIVRDDRGNVLHCLIDPQLPYTDRQIRLGLRLAANARYTGALAFQSSDRYRPHSLELSVGPMLRDDADRPFSVDVPQVAIPR